MSDDRRYPSEDEDQEGFRILGFEPPEEDDGTAEREADLPHWTQPPTGQQPAAGDEGDAWSTLSGSPRWRDQASDYDDYDDIRQLADEPPDVTDAGHGFSFEDAAGDRPPAGPDPSHMGPIPIVAPDAQGYEPPPGPGPSTGPAAPVPPGQQPAGRRQVDRNLAVAVGVGAILFGLALVVFWIGKDATAALVTVVVGIASLELLNTLRRVGYQPATLVALAASVCFPLAVHWRGETAIPLVIALTLAVTLVWYLVGVGTERPVPNTAVSMLVVLYVGLLGSYATLLLQFPNGIGMLLAAVIVTAAYDIGGFFVGRSAGRAPLSPVSPNKTVEGLVGGAIAAIAAAVVIVGLGNLTPFGDNPGGLSDAIILGLVVAVVAPIGDLCESLLKRDLGIKDMGSLLPGHGGVLDRVDALLFVLPATYYTARLLDLF